MSADVRVKICGLMDSAAVTAAVDAGAAYVGFVLFPPSPRSLAPAKVAALARQVPPGVVKVALTVDPDDTLLETLAALPIDMIQLHGSEPPERVVEVRRRTGLPTMKAIGIREAPDLAVIDDYAAVADQLLIDAKPPRSATRPGGNAVAFDWRLLVGRRMPLPWLLAGGLTSENVQQAMQLTGARQVDVSSGVEVVPGRKDAALIRQFVAAASDATGAAPPALRV